MSSRNPEARLSAIDENFIRRGAAGVSREQAEEVARSGRAVDAKFANRMLVRFAADARLAVLLVSDYLRGRYVDIPWWAIAAVVFSLIYALSPIDLIPDFIPVIGLMDDAAVFALCVGLVEKDLKRYAEWRARRRADEVEQGEGI